MKKRKENRKKAEKEIMMGKENVTGIERKIDMGIESMTGETKTRIEIDTKIVRERKIETDIKRRTPRPEKNPEKGEKKDTKIRTERDPKRQV